MSDNWIEIHDILRYCITNKVLEAYYQHEVENCFKILGWRKANDTLLSRISIPIGSTGYIQPDIVLQHRTADGAITPVVAIEIKRPDNIKNERQEAQLFSYMRQMRLNYGLYIGEKIQFFYDVPDNHDKPVPVMTVSIDMNDPNGDMLCQLFDYDQFNLSRLESFCKEQLDRENEKNRLSERFSAITNSPDASIKEILKAFLISEGFSEDVIISYLKDFTISIRKLQETLPTKSPITQIPVSPSRNIDVAGHDRTKFSFDGGKMFYSKRGFVLEVVKHYVSTHPGITFSELESVFYPKIHGSSRGVIKRYEEVLEMIRHSEDVKRRYFIDDIIMLQDGSKIVVNNQWGPTFHNFLKAIEGMYKVVSDRDYKPNR